jgi:hypothetical protein
MRRLTGPLVLMTVIVCVGMPARGGGIPLHTPAGLKAGDTFRFAFVTHGTTSAGSWSIAFYNSFVNSHAGGATYDGSVVHWLARGPRTIEFSAGRTGDDGSRRIRVVPQADRPSTVIPERGWHSTTHRYSR